MFDNTKLSDLTLLFTHETSYFYIDAYEVKGRKTPIYQIRNNDNDFLLGTISWYSPWRKFVLNTVEGIVFDYKCLRVLSDFLDEITKAYYNK